MPVASWRLRATLHQSAEGQWTREKAMNYPSPKRPRRQRLRKPPLVRASDPPMYLPGTLGPTLQTRKQEHRKKRDQHEGHRPS